MKVARQLNTRYLWSVGFWWLSFFTDIGPAIQEWQEYFSLIVVLVYLDENCASCMVDTFHLFAI